MNELITTININNTSSLNIFFKGIVKINGIKWEYVSSIDLVNSFFKYKDFSRHSSIDRKSYRPLIKRLVSLFSQFQYDVFNNAIFSKFDLNDKRLNRFIHFNQKNYTDTYFEIILMYYVIDESIISFLEQTNYKELADELKNIFKNIKINDITFDEKLTLKAKELLSLDLEDYVKRPIVKNKEMMFV